jgi:hypothetical protein
MLTAPPGGLWEIRLQAIRLSCPPCQPTAWRQSPATKRRRCRLPHHPRRTSETRCWGASSASAAWCARAWPRSRTSPRRSRSAWWQWRRARPSCVRPPRRCCCSWRRAWTTAGWRRWCRAARVGAAALGLRVALGACVRRLVDRAPGACSAACAAGPAAALCSAAPRRCLPLPAAHQRRLPCLPYHPACRPQGLANNGARGGAP